MQDKITFRNKVSLISFLLSLGVVYQHMQWTTWGTIL